jgi:hypothetical protein
MLRHSLSALVLASLAVPTMAAQAAPVDDIGCSARLVWFINQGRDRAKDTSMEEAKRAEAYKFVETMRGALGFYMSRIDTTAQADRSPAFVAAITEIAGLAKSDHDKLVEQTMACIDQFEATENRVLNSFKTKK